MMYDLCQLLNFLRRVSLHKISYTTGLENMQNFIF